MTKKITLKYWFFHADNIGNCYEDEKGNQIIVFDGIVKIGEPFYVRGMDGNNIDPAEIGLIDLLASFIVPKPDFVKK